MNALRFAALITSFTFLAGCGVGVEEDMGDLEALGDVESSLTVNSKFETFKGRDGQYYFQLIAGNGGRVLGSEGYSSLYSAKKGINSVKNHGSNESRYFLREASDGSFYFVIIATNGQIVAVSEMYSTKSNAQKAMGSILKVVQATTAQAPAIENDPRFQFFKGIDGKHYFHVRAGNGEIVIQSQGYASLSGAKGGATSVQNNGKYEAAYTVLPAADGKYYFVLKAANGHTIGRGETYETKWGAENGAKGAAELLSNTLPR